MVVLVDWTRLDLLSKEFEQEFARPLPLDVPYDHLTDSGAR